MSQLTNMMDQLSKLKNGVGVQSLLDSASQILGNPIVMFDTEYKLQAHTEAVTDDPYWNEVINQGIFSEETLSFFGDEGFIEDVANNPIITQMRSKKIKYDRIGGKIFNKNNTFVSLILIVACNKPFEDNDHIVFEAVCKLITREISKSEFYQEYEQIYLETIIKNLIDGNYDTKLDIAQIGIIYDSLEANLYVAAVDISLCDNHSDITYYRDLFKRAKPAYKYVVYSNYILIIISTNDDSFNVNKEFKKLIKIFERNNIYAGLSGKFENLFELEKYYAQAIKSLKYVLKCRCSQRIYPYTSKSFDTMKQIEALENGLGIQYFLDIAPKIFGNPVLFHDMEINLFACSRNVEINDPVLQELITYGTSSNETTELFRTTGMIDIMDNTKGGALLVSDKFKYDRISWKIYNSDNIRIGCTSMACSDRPFSEDELVLFGTFSRKFSKEVEKIEFYNNYGQVYSNTVISRLLSGKIDDYTFYTEDVSNLYDNLMDNLYLVAVDTTQCNSEYGSLSNIRRLFTLPNTVNRYAIYSTYIVVIISINDTLFCESVELNNIIKVFEQNNIYAGISSRFENIYDMQKYYIEAVNALKNKIMEKRQLRKYASQFVL